MIENPTSAPTAHPAPRRRWIAVIAAVLATVAAALLAAAGTRADTSAVLSETIDVSPPPTRSLTVSPGGIGICSPSEPLAFPNGECNSPAITITNGAVADDIDVQGQNAVPSDVTQDPGTAPPDWALCGSASTACLGSPEPGGTLTYPGQDQYEEWTDTEGSRGPYLSDTAQCDTAFNSYPLVSCAASAGQSQEEFVALVAPSASTDTSATFTSALTWTAAP